MIAKKSQWRTNNPVQNDSRVLLLLVSTFPSPSLSLSLFLSLAPAAAMEAVATDTSPKKETQQVLKVLEALKQASHDLHSNPSPNSPESNSSAIRALLELETESKSLLSSDPYLSALSGHLSSLKSILESFGEKPHGLGFRSLLARRVSRHEISRVAGSIESEIQAWIDRENVESLVQVLDRSPPSDDESLVKMLGQFVDRLGQGFNRELQDLILKSKLFSRLEVIICDPSYSCEVREQVAFTIAELISFNKDVFVGQVLMGETIGALMSMASTSSFQVLCLLIKSIKSPLVDELDNKGDIPKIVGFLKVDDLAIRVMAMNCVLEIGYYGRKEAVEAMLKADLIKILVELQGSELGGDLIEMGKWEEERKGGRRGREKRFLESHPFASCVARFAVQLEVGEGLRQREKRAFKQEVLKRVREACVSDAEAATIVAEVLWGSSP